MLLKRNLEDSQQKEAKGVLIVEDQKSGRRRKQKSKLPKEERRQMMENQLTERMQEKYGLTELRDANALREAYELIRIRRGEIDRNDYIQRRKAKS